MKITIIDITQDFINDHSFQQYGTPPGSGSAKIIAVGKTFKFNQPVGGYTHYSDHVANSPSDNIDDYKGFFNSGASFSVRKNGTYIGYIQPIFNTSKAVYVDDRKN